MNFAEALDVKRRLAREFGHKIGGFALRAEEGKATVLVYLKPEWNSPHLAAAIRVAAAPFPVAVEPITKPITN